MMKVSKEQKILESIITKAWEDAAFKQELIANPVAVIENFTGERINLPEGKTVAIQDHTDESVIYITIPPQTNLEDAELNEEELAVVAGGGVPGLRLGISKEVSGLFD